METILKKVEMYRAEMMKLICIKNIILIDALQKIKILRLRTAENTEVCSKFSYNG